MKPATRKLVNKLIAITTLFCMTTQGAFAKYLDLSDVPLFIGANVPPQVMLTISKEQQLYKKAYNDYSDLDDDGQPETTYKHDIDYYGYFDSYKCYTYDTGAQLFRPVVANARNGETDDNGKSTPAAIEANKVAKYCAAGSGQWSGNFLNWVSMSRMDTVRKLLYGGFRSTDTTSTTVLERAYVPTDAHAWSKYYPGRIDPATGQVVENDINKLTPFNPPITTATVTRTATTADEFYRLLRNNLKSTLPPPNNTDAYLDSTGLPAAGSSSLFVPTNYFTGIVSPFPIPNPPADSGVDVNVGFITPIQGDPANPVYEGDQILFTDAANPARSFTGVVVSFPAFTQQVARVRVFRAGIAPGAAGTLVQDLKITNLSRTGISFCNVTQGGAGANSVSHTNTNPPLIRVAAGNFALWSANERYQCQWGEEQANLQGTAGVRSNANVGALSGIQASAENPFRSVHGLGSGIAQGEFIARSLACVPGLFGTERCKQYPNGNYKPIGLLQEYGDVNLIQFGLMTGSYAKNVSGGVLRKNIGTFTDEVNVDTNGTFKTPPLPPGSPRSTTSAATPQGIVNTLNYMRIWGYDYPTARYIVLDSCTAQLTNIVENNCTNWGNPMAEIYFESVRYFAGNSPNLEYTFSNKGSKDNQLGLPMPAWTDPLNNNNYCAPINVLVFNASVSTNDDDLRAKSLSSINSPSTPAKLSNAIGNAEGITGTPYFIGKLLGASATPLSAPDFELCTPKTIPGLGDVSGICPEGPSVAGSYLMPGLAYHARTNRIRTNIDIPSTDARSLKVTTYGIQLATNVPQLVIPVPGSTTGQKVVIQPIYRLDIPPAGTPLRFDCPAGQRCFGGGTLVDLRYVEPPKVAGSITTGKVYIIRDDSEQGGDFDQDMAGTLEWRLDAAAGTITVTTEAVTSSTVNPQGFGYSISGTEKDGPHFFSGIAGLITAGGPLDTSFLPFNYTDSTGTAGTVLNTGASTAGCVNCRASDDTRPGQKGPVSATYKLGKTAAGTLQDPLWYAAKYGAFIDSNGNGIPDVRSEWDSKFSNGQQAPSGDGSPDTYFLVTNPLGLVAALDRAFIAILSNASASSVATNSTSLQTGTTIYQARFNANDWSGQVLAFTVDAQGKIASNPTWDAGQIINSQNPLDTASPPATTTPSTDADVIKGSGRSIITYNPEEHAGVPFRWPVDPLNPTSLEISSDLVAALNLGTSGSPPVPDGRGKERLNYLRGSQASEGAGVTGFRVRPISRLGDIVNSNPNFVAAPSAGFGDAKYADFRKDNIKRPAMIYVGGNDGMLHGFRAEDGREVLAYVPSMVHHKLNKLTDKTYVGSAHRFYVDGSPEIGDAFITGAGETDPAWHTVLVTSLGGGGQGLFALDITKPDNFSESNAAKTALWEFSDKDDPDLGFIYAQPTIRRMANGRFAAIVPGGYNNSKPETGELPCTDSANRLPAGCTTSSTGSAYLFIIFLDGPGTDGVWDEGKDYIKIRAAVKGDTATTPNGLTQPLAADVNGDGFVDFIYAGDLKGNLWKFDVRLPPAPSPAPAPVPNPGGDTSLWVSGNSRVILFVARDPDTNKRQPITGKPEATLHPTSGFIITFGTGKYIERNDPYPPSGPPPNAPIPYQTQSFYGIWDKDDAKPIGKAAADANLAPAPNQTVVTSRTQLLEHKIDRSVESAAIRVVVPLAGQPDVPDWSTDLSPPTANDSPPKDMGWLLDFPDAMNTGERSVFRPILTSGRLIFTTLLPSTAACQFGGTSFTMVIDPTTGGRIEGAVLDTDTNGLLNSKDVVSYGGKKDIYASGLQSTIGITPTPTIIRASSLPPDTSGKGSQILGTSGPLVASSGVLLAYALAAGSSGGNASTVIGLSAAGGRVSWRELMAQ